MLDGFLVGTLAQDVVQRVLEHLDAGLDDEQRNQHAHVGFERNARRHEHDCRSKHRRRQDGIEKGIGTGGHKRTGIHALALAFNILAEHELYHHGGGDNHQRDRRIVGGLRVNDFLDGFYGRGAARIQHDGSHNHGAQVLDASVAQRMLFVGGLVRKLRPHDGNYRGERVGEVVHRVEGDGDGTRDKADGGLERREHHVCSDAYDARAHNDLAAIFNFVIDHKKTCILRRSPPPRG